MLSPQTQKTHLHIFTPSKPSSPNSHSPNSSLLPSMKIKSLIHNLLFARICRIIRSLAKLKSFLAQVCHEARVLYLQDSGSELKKRKKKMNKYRKKILFGSFRLHYNWCSSSHVLPINYNYSSSSPSPPMEEADDTHMYYDSTWNSVFSTDGDDSYKRIDGDEAKNRSGDAKEGGFCGFEVDGSSQLSSYLEWLEEKGKKSNGSGEEDEFAKEMNEIDKLADMFIANCHEKFRLEKIESYRMYQEMLARGI